MDIKTKLPEWADGATWDADDDDHELVGVTVSAHVRRRRVGLEIHHRRYPRDPGVAVIDIPGRVRGLELPADVLIRAVGALWPERGYMAGFEAGQRDAMGEE